MDVYRFTQGSGPLLVSMPHVGTWIPEELQQHYQPRALQVEDTDWYLDRLYAFAADLGASLLVPRESRYVIDLNRPSDNTPMYTGTICVSFIMTGRPAAESTAFTRAARSWWRSRS